MMHLIESVQQHHVEFHTHHKIALKKSYKWQYKLAVAVYCKGIMNEVGIGVSVSVCTFSWHKAGSDFAIEAE